MGAVAETPVTLFTASNSNFAQRVRIALEEKRIPYTQVDVDFANKPKLLLQSNPIYAKVPTIIHNGKPLAESQVILQYLEEVWPQQVPLLPEGAYERSQARFWADYIHTSSEKLLDAASSKDGSPEQIAAREACVKCLTTLESAMTAFSIDGPFFTGEAFTYLDVMVAPLGNLIMLAEKLGGLVLPGPDEIPRAIKCLAAIAARPSYKAVVPPKDEALPILAAFFGK